MAPENSRQPVSQIESLTQLLEQASARANALKGSDSAEYEQCVADVREIISQLCEVIASGWDGIQITSDQVH